MGGGGRTCDSPVKLQMSSCSTTARRGSDGGLADILICVHPSQLPTRVGPIRVSPDLPLSVSAAAPTSRLPDLCQFHSAFGPGRHNPSQSRGIWPLENSLLPRPSS